MQSVQKWNCLHIGDHRPQPAIVLSCPSPVPFHMQQSSHLPENRQAEKSKHPSYPSSPQLPSILPQPCHPIGTGLTHSSNTLPPIATLSPLSTSPLPAHEPEHMLIDQTQSHSASPQTTQAAPSHALQLMPQHVFVPNHSFTFIATVRYAYVLPSELAMFNHMTLSAPL